MIIEDDWNNQFSDIVKFIYYKPIEAFDLKCLIRGKTTKA
jgi:hypothetical protein